MQGITAAITGLISHLGYPGVFVWMLLESACIPVPSEAVMPFASSLVASRHLFNLHALARTGAAGNLAGSIIAYWVGAWKGRGFFEKYGKYVLITKDALDNADKWFTSHGDATVLFTRVLPVVRTFISLPAGISRMPFAKFCAYTAAGSLPWCYLLTWIGFKLGQLWQTVGQYFHQAVIIICENRRHHRSRNRNVDSRPLQ